MKKKTTTGCIFAVISILGSFPLSVAYSYLLLKHVNGTDTMWTLFYIMWPLQFIVTVGFRIAESMADED